MSSTQQDPQSETTQQHHDSQQFSSPSPTFPIGHLPVELQHMIFAFYLSTIRLPLKPFCIDLSTPLAIASPLLAPPESLIYTNTTFLLSGNSFPSDVQRKHIQHVEVQERGWARDWVYMSLTHFPQLKSVTFVGNREEGIWEEALRDAFREGCGGKVEVKISPVRDWGRIERAEAPCISTRMLKAGEAQGSTR